MYVCTYACIYGAGFQSRVGEETWKEAYTCHEDEPQIDKDFAPFPEISRGMLDDSLRILRVYGGRDIL